MEREQNIKINDDRTKLDAVMWDYVTVGAGKGLSEEEVEHMYLHAMFCIESRRMFTGENMIKFLNGEVDESVLPDFSAVRDNAIKLEEGGMTKQRVVGLQTRAANLVDREIFQTHNNE